MFKNSNKLKLKIEKGKKIDHQLGIIVENSHNYKNVNNITILPKVLKNTIKLENLSKKLSNANILDSNKKSNDFAAELGLESNYNNSNGQVINDKYTNNNDSNNNSTIQLPQIMKDKVAFRVNKK